MPIMAEYKHKRHMKTYVIGYKKDLSHFEVIDSPEIARACLVFGNSHGIDRVIDKLPDDMVAILRQARKSTIELIWPNGDTLSRTSGRIDAKHTMEKLIAMGVDCLNQKQGGGLAHMYTDQSANR
jgi:hypothetical protein